MEQEFISFPELQTQFIRVEELKVDRARALAFTLSSSGHSRLVECRVITSKYSFFSQGDELVVYDSDIDVGQRPVNDIRYTERLAILFFGSDVFVPMVFALRDSFPAVLHRVSMPFEKPACLCIYDQPWEHLKLGWRPIQFLEDIRNWLAKTADNTLHPDDQPLEPLLLHFYGQIILPSDLRQGESLYVKLASESKNRKNFITTRNELPGSEAFQILILAGTVQEHGIISHSPRNLFDLQQFLEKAGIDLVSRIKEFLDHTSINEAVLKKQLMIVVILPKTNTAQTVNSSDWYSFILGSNLEQIAIALNIIERGPAGIGRVLLPVQATGQALSSVDVAVLLPYENINPTIAQFLSSPENVVTVPKIAQIGVGALGSQLFVNLAKTGYGKWKLIDDDILLPHNTVRHHLDQRYLGLPKCLVLAQLTNQSFQGEGIADGIWDDYLAPLNEAVLDDALEIADVIVDCSASIPVARDLAQRSDLPSKRISIFLNPKGTDLIVLGEDKDRRYPLDVLEFQYYRALIYDFDLAEHLESSDRIRYANSCRDITSRIPQESVAMHAAIGASNLKKYIDIENAQISIWHSLSDLSVKRIDVPVSEYLFNQVGEWKVYIDDKLITKISEARIVKLPNETGGILIGGYDFHRKIIYLVDTILSPSDSEESLTGYIRGTEGLKDALELIQSKTANNLRYAGEWHSHPKDILPVMSSDDAVLFLELKGKMDAAGLPTLMLIAADNQQIAIYID